MSRLIDRARRALSTAKNAESCGDAIGAANLAYYAAFDARRALVATVDPNGVPRTHTGLERRFGEVFVATGRVDRGIGRAFSRLMEIRLLADYGSDDILPQDARKAIEDATAVVDACAAAIEHDR